MLLIKQQIYVMHCSWKSKKEKDIEGGHRCQLNPDYY